MIGTSRLSFSRGALSLYVGVMIAVLALPSLILLPVAFSTGPAFELPPRAWSTGWFEKAFTSPSWQKAALVSLQLALMSSVLAIAIGVPAAIALSRMSGGVARYVRLLLLGPLLAPTMVLAVGLYIVFGVFGLLGKMLPLAFAHAVLVAPFVVLPVTARLMSLDPSLERAAASLGARQLTIIRRVTLPLISLSVWSGFALAFVFSFDEVVLAQFLSGPRLETLPRKMWSGIVMDGIDKTVTAITTVQVLLAVLVATAIIVVGWLRSRLRPAVSGAVEAGREPALNYASSGELGAVQADRAAKLSNGASDDAPHGLGVELQDICKSYGGLDVLDHVNMSIKPGEFVTVLGPSGSGKTTLLMMMAGFTNPNSGSLLLGDRNISTVPPHKREVGVVFQSYALFPHMNVARNVAFPLELRGLSKPDIEKRVAWALSKVQMSALAERRISQLSGGQQQRVALARAIVFDPRALLMDEPLAALDRNLRAQMQVELRSLQQSLGQTVLYVTHDQEEALNMSDRIAVLRDGRLQQFSSPKELYTRPANPFVANFFGEANLIEGRAHGGAFSAEGLSLPIAMSKAGAGTLCIRPEAIQLGNPTSDQICVPARVVSAQFQGSIVKIGLATSLGQVLVNQQTKNLGAIPEIGAETTMSWQKEMAHFMPH